MNGDHLELTCHCKDGTIETITFGKNVTVKTILEVLAEDEAFLLDGVRLTFPKKDSSDTFSIALGDDPTGQKPIGKGLEAFFD